MHSVPQFRPSPVFIVESIKMQNVHEEQNICTIKTTKENLESLKSLLEQMEGGTVEEDDLVLRVKNILSKKP